VEMKLLLLLLLCYASASIPALRHVLEPATLTSKRLGSTSSRRRRWRLGSALTPTNTSGWAQPPPQQSPQQGGGGGGPPQGGGGGWGQPPLRRRWLGPTCSRRRWRRPSTPQQGGGWGQPQQQQRSIRMHSRDQIEQLSFPAKHTLPLAWAPFIVPDGLPVTEYALVAAQNT